MTETAFYLVRHAYSDWTPDENRPLSDRGHKDAKRVADALHNCPIDVICSSPYRRARQTVEPLAERVSLPICIEYDLRERQLGHVSGDFRQAVRALWLAPSTSHPEGESNRAAQERGMTVVRRLQEEYNGGRIVLSTHGNLLALILQGFDPSVDYAFWRAMTWPDIFLLTVDQAGQRSRNRVWRTETNTSPAMTEKGK